MSRWPFDGTGNASTTVDYVGGVEPPHSYVHEASSSVVHHGDYLNLGDDHALCGASFQRPVVLGPISRPDAVCAECEAKLTEYHLRWWRETAETATAELEELRVKYAALATDSDSEPRQDPSSQQPQSHDVGGEPTSLLDRVRREVLDLGRRFDETIPYWRLKNSIDAFNEKLTSEERVVLAHEIGADGSLIRWCTRQIDDLGWQVTNNPVHGDADDMMDAWTHDLYQTPKKTKRRLGRFGSRDAS